MLECSGYILYEIDISNRIWKLFKGPQLHSLLFYFEVPWPQSKLYTVRRAITCLEMSHGQRAAFSCDKKLRMAEGFSHESSRVFLTVEARRGSQHTSTNDFKMEPFISPAGEETYRSRLKGSRHFDAADQKGEIFKCYRPIHSSYPISVNTLMNTCCHIQNNFILFQLITLQCFTLSLHTSFIAPGLTDVPAFTLQLLSVHI